ncbi:MAG: ADP-ribose pyrophosphatase YjhB (NUDIX family) [Candidatus Endobugula sp.]|jgi:ADP-ribose pyrophosphatase YjhB (NUDIX family)
MNFCSSCGKRVALSIPEDDNRERFVCLSIQCATIHYENPRIITGCLPIYGNKVLLCKRAIEPRYGLWTIPAGFMENGETTEQGALRESWEEAYANLHIDKLYALFNLPHINQVYFIYKADLLDTNFKASTESLEVALFSEEDIPWNDLAFTVVEKTLRRYFADRKQDNFPLHIENIEKKTSRNAAK